MSVSDNGIKKGDVAEGSTAIIITCFLALAIYNAIELNFIIFATFKQRRGLYFYSFLVATWGIPIYSIGFLLKNLAITDNAPLFTTLIVVGWCTMVTGQSVVLYSRLHLILRNRTRLRMVLIMIIVDAVICHTPIIVMVYGANSANPDPFVLPYSIYEKVQVTVFFIQELIISGLYIYQTTKMLRLEQKVGLNSRGTSSSRSHGRRIMAHLIVVNVIIVVLDITILTLEYLNLYNVQTAYKALVYAVKLKLEFSILNKLVELTRGNVAARQGGGANGGAGYCNSCSQRDTNVDNNTRQGTVGDAYHMDTFGDGSGGGGKRGTKVFASSVTADEAKLASKPGLGHSVFVASGRGRNRGSGGANGHHPSSDSGDVVVLTTELSIHREKDGTYMGRSTSGRETGPHGRRGTSGEVDSLGSEASAATTEVEGAGTGAGGETVRGTGAAALSTESQVQFAKDTV